MTSRRTLLKTVSFLVLALFQSGFESSGESASGEVMEITPLDSIVQYKARYEIAIVPMFEDEQWKLSFDSENPDRSYFMDEQRYDLTSLSSYTNYSTEGACELMYGFEEENISIQLFSIAKDCRSYEWMFPVGQDSIEFEYTTIVVVHYPEHTDLLLGKCTVLDESIDAAYRQEFSKKANSTDKQLPAFTSGANNFVPPAYTVFQNTTPITANHIKAWGSEPSWWFETKNNQALFEDMYQFQQLLTLSTNKVQWKYAETECITVVNFQNDSTELTVLNIDHTNKHCVCLASKNDYSLCGCPFAEFTEETGYEPYTCMLMGKTSTKAYGYLGCGTVVH